MNRRPRPGATAGFRIPIAIKFAALIAILVLAFMLGVTISAVRIAEENQEAQVNDGGIQVACTLAALIDPQWLHGNDRRTRLERVLGGVLEEAGAMGITDALVFDGAGQLLATGRGSDRIMVSAQAREIPYPPARSAGVEIRESRVDGRAIRSFRRAIGPAAGGGPEGTGAIEVLLSAGRIQESREAMRRRMMTLSAATCLAAAVGSFILAALLTRPIRVLVRDLRQVSLGHFDHQSRVRSGDEIGDLARAFNQMTENLRQAQEARIAQKATEHELALATQIQERLLPGEVPHLDGFDIAAFYQPAREVGGDYFDFIPIDEERLGLVVADVSGKGIPGSLVMTMTRSLLRMVTRDCGEPGAAVRQVNRALTADISPGMFVTLLYLVLHHPERRVQMVRAGHNGPLYYSAHTGKVLHLAPRGIALGLDPSGAKFESELEVQQFTFQEGDFLTAYTDGIVEEKDFRGEEYSQERLARMIREHAASSAGEIIQRILEDLARHRGDRESSDDVTLLVVKFTGAA